MNGNTPFSASRMHENHAVRSGGVVLRATRNAPLTQDLPEADLSNVIPFARRRRPGEEREAPALSVDAASRIAPWWNEKNRVRIAILLAGSLAVHAGLFAYFNREPEPLASIGIESISVEIVLGDNLKAGLAQTPSPTESDVTTRGTPQEQKPEDVKTETAKENKDVAKPSSETTIAEQGQDDIKTALAEVKPLAETKPVKDEKPVEAKPIEEAKAPDPQVVKPEAPQAAPNEATPEPQQPELAAAKPEYEQPSIVAPEPTPQKHEPKQQKQAAAAKDAPKKPRATRQASNDGKDASDRAPAASTYQQASSGIGAGRSDLDTNYSGIVRAHLARYKRTLSARSAGGNVTASVTFGLSSSGAVTSVRLARRTGDAIADEEAVAMVHRASPFPPPPDQRAKTFSIPINFDFR
jgi:periplasmic protein TonB